MRNGFQPERSILTGIRPVSVGVPKVKSPGERGVVSRVVKFQDGIEVRTDKPHSTTSEGQERHRLINFAHISFDNKLTQFSKNETQILNSLVATPMHPP